MDNLISIESRVKNILEQHTEARNNDMELYWLICDESLCMLPNYPNIPFDYVLRHYEKLGCPRFESVRRTRQMVQKNILNWDVALLSADCVNAVKRISSITAKCRRR